MKKVLSLLTALFAVGSLMAQTPTIVSTEVSKRNVVIEEFTGVGCGYCPDGHARANAICEQYEGHAWAINIHEGGYAAGSGYTTAYGDSIATLWTIKGYPCGSVNRISLTDRGQWAGQAANVRNEDSPVNVAATASIDPLSREMTVYVEAYFTGDQTETENLLNVALVQNNILGPQSNYGNYNSEYIEGNLYRHMHMLRNLLTGQWGESIATTKGTLVTKTYTYILPASIGAVPINNFDDLEVLVFITESNHKNIITGCEAEKSMLPGVYVSGFSIENEDCSLTFTPVISLTNTYEEAVTSWTIEYNGEEYTFSKSIAAGTADTIHLPAYTETNTEPETFVHSKVDATAKLLGYTVGGEEKTYEGSAITLNMVDMNIYTVAGPVKLGLGVDHYGSESSATLTNQSSCEEMWHSDAIKDRTGNKNLPARWYYYTLNPTDAGLYRLSVFDAYGDGMVSTYTSDGNVGISLTDAEGNEVFKHDGSFTDRVDFWLNITSTGDGTYEGIDDVAEVSFSVYPNPVHGELCISASQPVRMVELIDMNGRTVMTLGANSTKVNTESLANGIYVVRVTTESGIGMQKFVKE